MAKYGYCRVSSRSQLEGYSLEVQREAILNKYIDAIIVEEQYTGTTTNRPKFDKLVDSLQKGDILVVYKLDRFARTTLEGMTLMNKLQERGVIVEILNFGTIEGGFSSSNKLMMQIFFAFAEYERDCIVERTTSGKQLKMTKDADATMGRPKKFKKAQRDMALQLLEKHSYNEVAEMTGISRRTLIRYKKEAEKINVNEVMKKKEPKEIDLDKISQNEINKIAIENAKVCFDNKISPFGLNSNKKKEEKKKINFVQL